MKRLSIICAVLILGSLFVGGVIADCQANNVEIFDSYTRIQTSSVRDMCEGANIEVNYTNLDPDNGTTLIPGKLVHVSCYPKNDTTAVYDAFKTTGKTGGALFYNLPAGRCVIQSSGVSQSTFTVNEDPNRYVIEEPVLETSAPDEGDDPEMGSEEPKELINATREQLESNKTWNGVAGYIISLMLF